MAFPYAVEATFEQGTKDTFTTQTDTQTKLDFPHISVLAAVPQAPMPWRGAYCMRIDLTKGNADAFLRDTGAWASFSATTRDLRFMFWFGRNAGGQGGGFSNPTMADGDRFTIARFESAGPVSECNIFVEFTTANGYRLGINQTLSPTNAQYLSLTLNEWHCIEAIYVNNAGAGTLQLAIDGGLSTQVTGLTNAANTQFVLGCIGIPATTTNGVLFFDHMAVDTAQLGVPQRRFPLTVELTKSGHVCLGPGKIGGLALLGGNADNVLTVYDSDSAETAGTTLSAILELKPDSSTVSTAQELPGLDEITFTRGCYIALTGTNPRALATLKRGLSMSETALRNYFSQSWTPRGRSRVN